jgi:hypothetical protein
MSQSTSPKRRHNASPGAGSIYRVGNRWRGSVT